MSLFIDGEKIPTNKAGAFELKAMARALLPLEKDKARRKDLCSRFNRETHVDNLEEFVKRAAPLLGLSERDLTSRLDYESHSRRNRRPPAQQQHQRRRSKSAASAKKKPPAPRKRARSPSPEFELVPLDDDDDDEDDDDFNENDDIDLPPSPNYVLPPLEEEEEEMLLPTRQMKILKANRKVLGVLAQMLTATSGNSYAEREFRIVTKNTAMPFLAEVQRIGPAFLAPREVPGEVPGEVPAAPQPGTRLFGVSERARELGLAPPANPSAVGRRAAELFRNQFPHEVIPQRLVYSPDVARDVAMNLYSERTAPDTLDVALREVCAPIAPLLPQAAGQEPVNIQVDIPVEYIIEHQRSSTPPLPPI